MPAAILETDSSYVFLAVFDVNRPDNKRRILRKRVVPSFEDKLNLELLVDCQTKKNKQKNHGSFNLYFECFFCIVVLQEFSSRRKKVSEVAQLNKAYDHAYQFRELRLDTYPDLTVRQYLSCCFQCKSKLKITSFGLLKKKKIVCSPSQTVFWSILKSQSGWWNPRSSWANGWKWICLGLGG